MTIAYCVSQLHPTQQLYGTLPYRETSATINPSGIVRPAMKKLKHEAELVKAAIAVGVKYAEARGVAQFEATDSANDKILYLYRLFVRDKLIQALPEDQVSQQSMRHKLAIWYSKQLPKDHPLLQ